ncbi:MAG: CaiB/BaiF CoA-transferase family protein [Saprospiraceae bacterium]
MGVISALKVLDMSSVLAGPLTGSFFAELGCKVTKIENKTIGGDPTRQWKLTTEDSNSDFSAYYASANYGKEIIMLDFKNEDDLEKLWTLIQAHDIIISNFQRKVSEKFGLSPKAIQNKFPDKIIAQLSAYDYDDPRPGYDLVMQGETGWISMNGIDQNHMAKLPVALIDIIAAHQMKEAILMAVLKKYQSGEGSIIHVSLYKSALSALANQASNYLMAQHIPKPMSTLHPNIAPYGDTFTTSDGELVLLAIGSDAQFAKLWVSLNLGEIIDSRFILNSDRVRYRNEMVTILTERIKSVSLAEFTGLMNKNNLPWSKIHNLKDVFESEQGKKIVLEYNLNEIVAKAVSQVAFSIE